MAVIARCRFCGRVEDIAEPLIDGTCVDCVRRANPQPPPPPPIAREKPITSRAFREVVGPVASPPPPGAVDTRTADSNVSFNVRRFLKLALIFGSAGAILGLIAGWSVDPQIENLPASSEVASQEWAARSIAARRFTNAGNGAVGLGLLGVFSVFVLELIDQHNRVTKAAQLERESASLEASLEWETRLKESKSALDSSMDELRCDPSNPELRQRALSLGRAYAALTREDNTITTYDELALKNDLDAACAGAAMASPIGASAASLTAANDPVQRLRKLKDMLDSGLVSQSEFDDRKKRILDDV